VRHANTGLCAQAGCESIACAIRKTDVPNTTISMVVNDVSGAMRLVDECDYEMVDIEKCPAVK
jgi:hypothetical protein